MECTVSAATRQASPQDETESFSTFPEMFAAVVSACAERDALVVAEETLNYRDLDRRSAKMARAMLAIGVGKGIRIALLAPDGALWLTTFYAALRIGALVTPISTLATANELAQIIRTSDAQIVIGVRRFLDHDYAENLMSALPELSGANSEALLIAGAPYLRSVWLDDVTGLPWAWSLDDLLTDADAPEAPDAALLAAVEQQV